MSAGRPRAVNIDDRLDRAARSKLRRLDRADFIGRVRFRDAAGNRYALPHPKDVLYQTYLKSGVIDGSADPADSDDSSGSSSGTSTASDDEVELGRRSLLYVSKPITRKLVPVKRAGERLRLLDMRSKHVYEGRVERFFFAGRERSGHTVLADVSDAGPVLDVRE